MQYETVGAEKHDAIVRVFREALGRYGPQGLQIGEIIRIAYNSPAPRFYVAPATAKKFVKKLIAGKDIPVAGERSRDMYHEIYRRFVSRGCSDISEIDDIINEQAPSFYLSYNSFQRFVYLEMRKTKCKR